MSPSPAPLPMPPNSPPGPAGPVDAEILHEVTARLVAAVAPERVLLFGSHAWGVPHADSDLDLYLIVPHGSGPAHRIARLGHLALRGLGVPVDLVVRTRSESARNAEAVASLDHAVLHSGVPLHG